MIISIVRQIMNLQHPSITQKTLGFGLLKLGGVHLQGLIGWVRLFHRRSFPPGCDKRVHGHSAVDRKEGSRCSTMFKPLQEVSPEAMAVLHSCSNLFLKQLKLADTPKEHYVDSTAKSRDTSCFSLMFFPSKFFKGLLSTEHIK